MGDGSTPGTAAGKAAQAPSLDLTQGLSGYTQQDVFMETFILLIHSQNCTLIRRHWLRTLPGAGA